MKINLTELKKIIKEVIQENTDTLTPKEVVGYIKQITPFESDIPTYFLDQILNSGKLFKKKTLNIEQILKNDPDAKEYVDSNEDRYEDDDEYEPQYEELYYPIVILNNVVLDGYSRLATNKRNGEDTIIGYIA